VATYWERTLKNRTSRRTAIAGGLGLAGAAAILAACGGGDEGPSEETRTGLGKLLYENKNAETPIKKGGTLNAREGGDLPSIDPYRQIAGISQTFGGHLFSRLVQYKTEPGLDPGLAEKAPDAAERWEVSDGGLTYTFKIRPNVKFHPATTPLNTVAGLNGRILDAEDVVASYERFKGLPAPQYQQSFGGKVESITAPDKSTVVWKLTRPNAIFLEFVTSGQYLWLMGKEAGGAYNTLEKAVGTGPWMLDSYLPSSRWLFKRHPEYWQKDLPHMDGIETYIVPEVSQYLAQFQVGTFPTFNPTLAGDMQDLAEGKTDRRIYKNEIGGSTAGIGFGRGDPNSPFLKDNRLRQAVSVAIDRDTITEVLNDVDAWRALGLDREYHHINAVVGVGFSKWWTDPRGPEMGEEAQFFEFDPQKAKQLLSAGGFPNGLDTEMHFAANNYAQIYRDKVQLFIGYLKEVGINAEPKPDDYGTVHNIRGSAGELPGMVAHQNTGFGDPALLLDYLFSPGASRNMMKVDDPIFNDLNAKQSVELDEKKRRDIFIQIYRHLTREMRFVPYSDGSIAGFTVAYDWYRNYGAYRNSLANQGGGTENLIHRWISKA
jgi:peptide/nickel transport system substrate-binding protein